MKSICNLHIILSLLLVLIVGTSTSPAKDKKISRKQIPAAVKKAFEDQYPHAKIKGQSIETEKAKKYYEIESVDGTTTRDLLYTLEGKVVEIEESIDSGTLPDTMKSTLSKEYPKGKILKAEKVTRDTLVTYEVQVKVGKKTKGVTFDASGKILKTDKTDEEKEEKGDNEEEND
jgi:hypothetical protein